MAWVLGARTESWVPFRNAGQWVIGTALGLYFTPQVGALIAGLWWAIALGIAWAFGKASVFKYISNDYPNNIGTISGIVGLAGGLGGFVLPIMFGYLLDLTGIRSSAFMLLYGVVWVSLIWMYLTEVRTRDVLGGEPQGAVVGQRS